MIDYTVKTENFVGPKAKHQVEIYEAENDLLLWKANKEN